jgi:hypothetical protein
MRWKARITAMSNEAEMPRQLQTMLGVGPITALAVEAFAPPMDQFGRGRDFAAWLGLVPRQHSSGGKQRLGKTSKTGQRDIRRLLVTGAMAVVRWVLRRGAPQNPWLERMLETQAAYSRGLRTGQQDGAQDLGDAHARRGLSRSADRQRCLIRQQNAKTGPQSCKEGMNRMGT